MCRNVKMSMMQNDEQMQADADPAYNRKGKYKFNRNALINNSSKPLKCSEADRLRVSFFHFEIFNQLQF